MVYKYGLKYRPPGPGAVPNGFIKYEEEHADFRWGVLYYPEKLCDKEVYEYELTFIGQE
jgi:hypothetical protein